METHREVSYMSEGHKIFRVITVRDPKGEVILLFELEIALHDILPTEVWLHVGTYREMGNPGNVANIRVWEKVKGNWPQIWRAIVKIAMENGWVAWWSEE